MHCSIQTCSILITIVILSELFRFNSGHPINFVQSVSAKSSHLEQTSIEDSSSIILPDRDLSPLRVTNDSSPISEKDILFKRNSNSSSFLGTDNSSFVIRDIQGRNTTDRPTSPSTSNLSKNFDLNDTSLPQDVVLAVKDYLKSTKQNKNRKTPKAKFLFRKTIRDPRIKIL